MRTACAKSRGRIDPPAVTALPRDQAWAGSSRAGKVGVAARWRIEVGSSASEESARRCEFFMPLGLPRCSGSENRIPDLATAINRDGTRRGWCTSGSSGFIRHLKRERQKLHRWVPSGRLLCGDNGLFAMTSLSSSEGHGFMSRCADRPVAGLQQSNSNKGPDCRGDIEHGSVPGGVRMRPGPNAVTTCSLWCAIKLWPPSSTIGASMRLRDQQSAGPGRAPLAVSRRSPPEAA